jgi:hypothetical protein
VTRLAESELTPDIFLCLFPISAINKQKKKKNEIYRKVRSFVEKGTFLYNRLVRINREQKRRGGAAEFLV